MQCITAGHCLAAVFLLGALPATHGAGLEVPGRSAADIGGALVGAATLFHGAAGVATNPATLAHLDGHHFSVGLNVLSPAFDMDTRVERTLIDGDTGTVPGMGAIRNAGTWAAPSLYYTHGSDGRLAFGVGLYAPFGTRSELPSNWAGRYHTTRSRLTLLNLAPVLAWQISPTLSIGFGPVLQGLDADFRNKVDIGFLVADAIIRKLDDNPLVAPDVDHTLDTLAHRFDIDSRMRVDSVSFGATAGLLWQAGPNTRIGLHYLSRVRHSATGHAQRPQTEDPAYVRALADAVDSVRVRVLGIAPTRLGTLQPGAGDEAAAKATGPLGAAGGPVALRIDAPDVLTLSLRVGLDETLALTGGVTWTRWSLMDELRFRYRDGTVRGGQDLTGTGDDVKRRDLVQPMAWRDTLRYGLGLEMTPTPHWVLRAGIARDQSPVPNAQMRTPVGPDSDRLLFATGASRRLGAHWTADLAYAYFRFDTARLDHFENPSGTRHRIVGQSRTRIHGLALQLGYGFGGSSGATTAAPQ